MVCKQLFQKMACANLRLGEVPPCELTDGLPHFKSFLKHEEHVTQTPFFHVFMRRKKNCTAKVFLFSDLVPVTSEKSLRLFGTGCFEDKSPALQVRPYLRRVVFQNRVDGQVQPACPEVKTSLVKTKNGLGILVPKNRSVKVLIQETENNYRVCESVD